MYLSNTVSSCQEWLVADVNHDNTEGTVDLFSKYVVAYKSKMITSSDDINSQCYEISDIRTMLNTTILDGFYESVKNIMKYISIDVRKYGGSVYKLQDKVKCPSITEFGYYWKDTMNGTTHTNGDEGSIYPLFGSSVINGYDASVDNSGYNYRFVSVLDSNGTNTSCITRSLLVNEYNLTSVYYYRYFLDIQPKAAYSHPIWYARADEQTNVVAIIRFGK